MCFGIKVQMNLFQHSCGVFIHFIMIHHGQRTDFLCRITPHINIFSDAPLRNRLQFLMHHGNSAVQGVQRPFDLNMLTFINHFTLVHVINTEHTLHKGGLSGAVFTHKRVDCTRPQIQLRAVQCPDARKCLDDIMHFQTILWQFAVSLHHFFYPRAGRTCPPGPQVNTSAAEQRGMWPSRQSPNVHAGMPT